jgi:hypothetical protein
MNKNIMKRSGVAFAAVCALLAVATPDWKAALHAETGAYGEVQYKIPDALVVQKLKVSGCKTVTSQYATNVELYKDFTFYYGAANGAPVQGEWSLVKGKFYLTNSSDAQNALFGMYDALALQECKNKYPTASYVEVVPSTVTVAKNMISVQAKTQKSSALLLMKGKQVNDLKGAEKTAGFSVKTSMKGTLVEVQ